MASRKKIITSLFQDILSTELCDSDVEALLYAEKISAIADCMFGEQEHASHCDRRGPVPYMDYEVSEYMNSKLAWRDSSYFHAIEFGEEQYESQLYLHQLLEIYPQQSATCRELTQAFY